MPRRPIFGPSPNRRYVNAFHALWLTDETMIDPEIDRITPHITPMTNAFVIKIATCPGGRIYPCAVVAYETCQRAKSAPEATSVAPLPSPARPSAAHNQP